MIEEDDFQGEERRHGSRDYSRDSIAPHQLASRRVHAPWLQLGAPPRAALRLLVDRPDGAFVIRDGPSEEYVTLIFMLLDFSL